MGFEARARVGGEALRIQLELDDYQFTTTTDNFPIGLYGPTERRWLMVMVGGKKFYTQRTVEPDWMYKQRDHRAEIDKVLIETMQVMLESILLNAAAKTPDGVIETRCPSGELWRFHYEARCGCKTLAEIENAGRENIGEKRGV